MGEEPCIISGALCCPRCSATRAIYTPFVEGEAETGCFRCGYEWPPYAIQKKDLPTVDECRDEVSIVSLCKSCKGPIHPGATFCMGCNNWTFSGLPIK